MFRGREITHKELGSAILDDVIKDLKDVAVVEQMPRMEGRQMFMIIGPNPKVAQRARDLARQQAVVAEAGNRLVEGKKTEGAADAGRPEGQPAIKAPAPAPAAPMASAPALQAGG
jgi:translation initiation factor IF-3